MTEFFAAMISELERTEIKIHDLIDYYCMKLVVVVDQCIATDKIVDCLLAVDIAVLNIVDQYIVIVTAAVD